MVEGRVGGGVAEVPLPVVESFLADCDGENKGEGDDIGCEEA